MAVKDVLDQSQSQTGSTLRAAFFHVDAIEAFGQPRQMFRCDAGTIIADTDLGLRLFFSGDAGTQSDVDAFAWRAVFERVLPQVLEDAHKFVAVAEHDQGIR